MWHTSSHAPRTSSSDKTHFLIWWLPGYEKYSFSNLVVMRYTDAWLVVFYAPCQVGPT